MTRKLILLALATLTLGACASRNENIQPPRELSEITPTIQVHRLWWARIGDGAGDSGLRLRPAYADGVVYAASTNGQLRAIDAHSGETLWKSLPPRHGDVDTRYAGGPSVADGLVVVGTMDGHVESFDAKTGARGWTANVGAAVVSPPVLVGEHVLVRTNDGNVHALKRADGSAEWLYDRGNVPLLSLRGNGPLLVANGVVFFGTDDGKLQAVRLSDGAPLWQQTVATGEGRTDIAQLNDSDGSLVLDGTTIYVAAYHGQLLAIEAPTGRPLWNHELSTYTGLAVGGTHVLAVDDSSDIWAFDTATGDNVWKQDQLEWRWLSAPAVQGEQFVVGDTQGYVHWLNVTDGKFAARQRLSHDAIRAQPLVVGNIVFVEDVDGHLAAYQVGTAAGT
ncbi:MAG TPA: outer membrane protein assembly factor BamB [Rhodanobacteraceae bacterium]|nr:outer membrane protein assembly factor BamB [Rhodanobacteraceae bacterium]